MPNLQLDTACEGPLALNDNAFELCREFIKPQGDRFFQQVSRYDDYLAEVAKRPGYKAGDTPQAHPALLQGPRSHQCPDRGLFVPKPGADAGGGGCLQVSSPPQFPHL